MEVIAARGRVRRAFSVSREPLFTIGQDQNARQALLLFSRRPDEIVICPCQRRHGPTPSGTRASIFIQRPISNRRDKFCRNLRSPIIFAGAFKTLQPSEKSRAEP